MPVGSASAITQIHPIKQCPIQDYACFHFQTNFDTTPALRTCANRVGLTPQTTTGERHAFPTIRLRTDYVEHLRTSFGNSPWLAELARDFATYASSACHGGSPTYVHAQLKLIQPHAYLSIHVYTWILRMRTPPTPNRALKTTCYPTTKSQ